MSQKRFTSIILFSLCVVAIGFAGEQSIGQPETRNSPRLFNYQGYLTDSSGILITNPSMSITFSKYDVVNAGSQRWTETQTVDVKRGVFSVILGAVNPIPDSVFVTGTDRWFELILPGPTTLSPRTRITSMPYSYTATYSDTASYARNVADDNDWVRGTPDNVLYTANRLGIVRGGSNNTLYGNNRQTHSNFGVSGQNYAGCAVLGGERNVASGAQAVIAGGSANSASGAYSFIGSGYYCYATGEESFVGGYADTITATGDYSYLFGINSNLTQDSTFMVDMPHVWFGTESAGYEFPRSRAQTVRS